MTVYVDSITPYPRGTVKEAPLVTGWRHMYANELGELHEMAERLGMKPEWFQPYPEHSLPHYDLSRTRRAQAIVLGAVEKEIQMEDFLRWRMQP